MVIPSKNTAKKLGFSIYFFYGCVISALFIFSKEIRARICKRLKSPEIDSARLHRVAESIPWNRFLSSLKVYKFGLWVLAHCWENYCRNHTAYCTKMSQYLFNTSMYTHCYTVFISKFCWFVYREGKYWIYSRTYCICRPKNKKLKKQ